MLEISEICMVTGAVATRVPSRSTVRFTVRRLLLRRTVSSKAPMERVSLMLLATVFGDMQDRSSELQVVRQRFWEPFGSAEALYKASFPIASCRCCQARSLPSGFPSECEQRFHALN